MDQFWHTRLGASDLAFGKLPLGATAFEAFCEDSDAVPVVHDATNVVIREGEVPVSLNMLSTCPPQEFPPNHSPVFLHAECIAEGRLGFVCSVRAEDEEDGQAVVMCVSLDAGVTVELGQHDDTFVATAQSQGTRRLRFTATDSDGNESVLDVSLDFVLSGSAAGVVTFTLPPTLHWIRASNGHVGPNDPPVVLKIGAEGPSGEPLHFEWSAKIYGDVVGVFTSGTNADTGEWAVTTFPHTTSGGGLQGLCLNPLRHRLPHNHRRLLLRPDKQPNVRTLPRHALCS